jgi:hypothetical protein
VVSKDLGINAVELSMREEIGFPVVKQLYNIRLVIEGPDASFKAHFTGIKISFSSKPSMACVHKCIARRINLRVEPTEYKSTGMVLRLESAKIIFVLMRIYPASDTARISKEISKRGKIPKRIARHLFQTDVEADVHLRPTNPLECVRFPRDNGL